MAAIVGRRDAYVGEKKKQLRDGFGVYVYENKFFKYEGEWEEGQKHGHGKLVMADGSYYEGEFQQGEIEGHGYKYFSASRDHYSGEFHMGELHGQGVMKYGDSAAYEGQWYRNMRQGYGIFRKPDNSVYQGYLHEHKRHGEGTQKFSNGDLYVGDWIGDLQQGHGEFRAKSGTVYVGQFRGGVYNGEGAMTHSSGMSYEGLWINGRPAQLATKLVIKTEGPLQGVQGTQFEISIECQDDEGNIVQEQGRHIRVTAGFRHVVPKMDSKSEESTASGLFDMIEDVEETPVTTPFGYDIVSYPLEIQTNATRPELPSEGTDLSLPRENTDLSEIPIEKDSADPGTDSKAPLTEDATEEVAKAKVTADGDKEEEVSKADSRDTERENPAVDNDNEGGPKIPEDVRVQNGVASFQDLILPAAPPMYRPFAVMDSQEERGQAMRSQKSRTGGRAGKPGSTDESRPSTRASKNQGDERYARPGEYVIMVQDVTTPPFMDQSLESAFLQVVVTLPKKIKKSKTAVKGQNDSDDSSGESS